MKFTDKFVLIPIERYKKLIKEQELLTNEQVEKTDEQIGGEESEESEGNENKDKEKKLLESDSDILNNIKTRKRKIKQTKNRLIKVPPPPPGIPEVSFKSSTRRKNKLNWLKLF
jgi:hypothetical protein